MATDPQLAEPARGVLPETLAGGLEIIAARTLGDPDDVRDAVQETFARTVEANRHRRIPETVSVGAFAYGIARHVIADVLRRRRTVRTANPSAYVSCTPASFNWCRA